MAIYKSSNCSPQLSEIDFDEDNTFSCVVNTSGEPAKAYKLKILSENGDITYYDPTEPTNLPAPVQNKGILKINNVKRGLSPYPSNLVNGKNYLWGARVYNAPKNSAAQPNTLVTDGFLVGSTKNVIWSKIPKNHTGALEQLKYDRYIEFTNIDPSNMFKGAKDDEYPALPSTNYTERQKIDWVTTGLGNDENIVKIETVDPFTYNYVDGTMYNIYLCSDKHTVKSVYADPNSNINVSNYIMIYDNIGDAVSARGLEDTPDSITVAMADCMKLTSDSDSGYGARKIGGYSSDTGEIRILDSFNVAPKNNQYYRLFEYNSIDKMYKAIDDEIIETVDSSDNPIQIDPLYFHRIGGTPVGKQTGNPEPPPLYSADFVVLNNIWDSESATPTYRLFIQPNINIVSDRTNPDELVFENGVRIDIKRIEVINPGEPNEEEVDVTFNKLDNTQWLLEWDDNPAPNVIIPAGAEVPIICQTDYKVYTDFSDISPYNLFYARETPVLTLQYRNVLSGMLSPGTTILPGYYINPTTFNDSNGDPYTPSSSNVYYDISTSVYYRYKVSHIPDPIYEAINAWVDVEEDINNPQPFREAEFTCLWKNSQDEDMLDPQIKSYQFFLYAYDANYRIKTLIAQSDEYYNTTPSWIFRGLDGIAHDYYDIDHPHRYNIKIKIIDEYDREYVDESDFYIYYNTDKSFMPLIIDFNCNEHAIDIEVNSPVYAKSVSSGGLTTITSDDLNAETSQVIIEDEKTLNYAQLVSEEDVYLSFPSTFSLFTQFQITENFVNSIPVAGSKPLFEIVHELYDIGTHYYLRTISSGTTYYSDSALQDSAGQLSSPTECSFVNTSYSTINLNGDTYYVETVNSGELSSDCIESDYVSYIDSVYSTITINNVTYNIPNSQGLENTVTVLEKFTVKLNSFDSYYVENENNTTQIIKNNDQYKVKVYKGNSPDALFDFNIINNGSGGSSTTARYTLQAVGVNRTYHNMSSLGNPENYNVNDRYILLNAATGYGNIVYDAGIYRVLTNGGGKYWAHAIEEEYIFLENLSQLNGADYDSLSVPSNARGEDGDLKYEENGDNWWLDSSINNSVYNDLLYSKFVNFFLKVIVNEDKSETITCEIAVVPEGV